MCQKLATPRGQVYQITKTMRGNAGVSLRARIEKAGGKDDRLQRLGHFIPELSSLTLSYIGTSVQTAVDRVIPIEKDKASERAKKRLTELLENNGQKLRDLSIEDRIRTLYETTADLDPDLGKAWQEDLEKLRPEINKWKKYGDGLRKFDDRVTSHDNSLGSPFEPFRPTAEAGIAKIREQLTRPPSAEDLLQAVADYSQPRSRLGDQARDLAWKYLHLTPTHPLLRKNPERFSSGKAEPTLADKIISVWDEKLKHVTDVDLLSENGVERTANDLAIEGRKILAVFFNDIADTQANAWHLALGGVTSAPTKSREDIAKEFIGGQAPAQIANFWQIGPGVASLPYWLKGHWRDPSHAIEYGLLLDATGGPKDLKPYKNVTKDSTNSETARTDVMEHHKLWWNRWIPSLMTSFDKNSPETVDRMAIVRRCSAYWTLVTAGGDGPGFNPFEDALVNDNTLGNPLAGDTRETLDDRIRTKIEPKKYTVEDLAKKLNMSIFETAKMLDKRNSDFEFRDKYVEQAIRKSLEEQKAKEAAKQPSQGGERRKPPEATTQPAPNEGGPK